MSLMDNFNKPFVFVDVETTGLNPRRDRVIEIALVKYEDGKVTESFETLVNPNRPVSQHIQRITGINPANLPDAPEFHEIRNVILDILQDAVFVAHNCAFDYGFVSSELYRLGDKLEMPRLCTVQLSRKLFPHEYSHSLESVIAAHKIDVTDRHRALADTEAIVRFFKIASEKVDDDIFNKTVEGLIKN